MAEMLRIGLVGCGGMGNEHLKLIKRIPDVQLVGVCDQRESRAERMRVQHNIAAWQDFEQFLDQASPDIVHICTPSGLHALHGIAAAERGVHVLCEKPLDIDLQKVDRLIDVCEKKDVRLGCIFQRRMSAAARVVQTSISEGRMGRILSCSVSVKWWRTQSYYDKDDWRGTWAMDGGAFSNQGIHSLDQMIWLAGPVAEVEYAHLETASHQMEAEDMGIAVVRFANGARGTIEVTTCCQPDLSTHLEIYGTKGSAAFQDASVVRFGLNGEDLMHTLPPKMEQTGGGSDPFAISLAGHDAQIRDFYTAVREHRAPLVDGREARPSVELLTMIYAKAFPHVKLGV